MNRDLPRLGLILLALVTIGWGTSWPAMKVSLNEIPPWTFRGLVVPAGGIILFGLARAGNLPLAVPRRHWRTLAVVSFFNVLCWQVMSAYGVSLMASGRAAVIAYTMPLWASIFAVFVLGEAMTWRRAAALVLGMGAIWVLLSGEMDALGKGPLGVVFIIGAAMSWALGMVLIKRVDWQMPTLSLAAWQLLLAGIPIAVVALPLELGDLKPVSAAAVVAVIYTILGPICLCNYAYTKVVRLFPAAIAAIGTLCIPVVGVMSSSWVVGEPVGWREVAALALVCPALALVLFRSSADSG